MNRKPPLALAVGYAATLALLVCAGSTPTAAFVADDVSVAARAIEPFDTVSGRVRFGSATFVGGFTFSSEDSRVGGISALRFVQPGETVLAVTDSGDWLTATIERNAQGRPVGLSAARIGAMLAPDGRPMSGKVAADAESLAILGSRAFVGFEHDHRVLSFADPAAPFESVARTERLPIPRGELRRNQGIETLASAPAGSPLAGQIVAVTENSIDRNGNLFAAILGARPDGGDAIFKIRKDEEWNVSDGTFLPDGDLLLLERRYTGFFGGLGIRLRRIGAETIRSFALVDGPVVAQFDLGQEIDNMEGVDAWTDASGATRLTLVSDDNHSFFQRNVVLEFTLSNEAAPSN